MSFSSLEALTVRTRVARVNLLPNDFAEARKARRVRVALGAGVLAVGALCAGAALISSQHVSDAQSALDAEQAKTAPLQAAQKPYAEVPKVLAELKTAQTVKQTVDQYDIAWYSYLDRVSTASPSEFALTSLAFTVDTPSNSSTTTVGTNPLATPGVGTITVSGQTKSQDTIAAWLDAVAGIQGIAAPTLANSALDAATGVVSFNATATLTDQALQSNQQ